MVRRRRGDAGDAVPKLSVLVPVKQAVIYVGEPKAVARLGVVGRVRLVASVRGVIATDCDVGEALVDASVLLGADGGFRIAPEPALTATVLVGVTRTFEQDPNWEIRRLAIVATRGFSPAVEEATAAVQALDHFEDLLRRLRRRKAAR